MSMVALKASKRRLVMIKKVWGLSDEAIDSELRSLGQSQHRMIDL